MEPKCAINIILVKCKLSLSEWVCVLEVHWAVNRGGTRNVHHMACTSLELTAAESRSPLCVCVQGVWGCLQSVRLLLWGIMRSVIGHMVYFHASAQLFHHFTILNHALKRHACHLSACLLLGHKWGLSPGLTQCSSKRFSLYIPWSRAAFTWWSMLGTPGLVTDSSDTL